MSNSGNVANHHLLPRSRCPERKRDSDNIRRVSQKRHKAWHRLFANMVPHEVISLIRGAYGIGLTALSKETRHLLMHGVQMKLDQPSSVAAIYKRGLPLGRNQRLKSDWNLLFGYDADGFTAITVVIAEWLPSEYQVEPTLQLQKKRQRMSRSYWTNKEDAEERGQNKQQTAFWGQNT